MESNLIAKQAPAVECRILTEEKFQRWVELFEGLETNERSVLDLMSSARYLRVAPGVEKLIEDKIEESLREFYAKLEKFPCEKFEYIEDNDGRGIECKVRDKWKDLQDRALGPSLLLWLMMPRFIGHDEDPQVITNGHFRLIEFLVQEDLLDQSPYDVKQFLILYWEYFTKLNRSGLPTLTAIWNRFKNYCGQEDQVLKALDWLFKLHMCRTDRADKQLIIDMHEHLNDPNQCIVPEKYRFYRDFLKACRKWPRRRWLPRQVEKSLLNSLVVRVYDRLHKQVISPIDDNSGTSQHFRRVLPYAVADSEFTYLYQRWHMMYAELCKIKFPGELDYSEYYPGIQSKRLLLMSHCKRFLMDPDVRSAYLNTLEFEEGPFLNRKYRLFGQEYDGSSRSRLAEDDQTLTMSGLIYEGELSEMPIPRVWARSITLMTIILRDLELAYELRKTQQYLAEHVELLPTCLELALPTLFDKPLESIYLCEFEYFRDTMDCLEREEPLIFGVAYSLMQPETRKIVDHFRNDYNKFHRCCQPLEDVDQLEFRCVGHVKWAIFDTHGDKTFCPLLNRKFLYDGNRRHRSHQGCSWMNTINVKRCLSSIWLNRCDICRAN